MLYLVSKKRCCSLLLTGLVTIFIGLGLISRNISLEQKTQIHFFRFSIDPEAVPAFGMRGELMLIDGCFKLRVPQEGQSPSALPMGVDAPGAFGPFAPLVLRDIPQIVPDINSNDRFYVLLWPLSFDFHNEADGQIFVKGYDDRRNNVQVKVGEMTMISGSEIDFGRIETQLATQIVGSPCKGPYWFIGGMNRSMYTR